MSGTTMLERLESIETAVRAEPWKNAAEIGGDLGITENLLRVTLNKFSTTFTQIKREAIKDMARQINQSQKTGD